VDLPGEHDAHTAIGEIILEAGAIVIGAGAGTGIALSLSGGLNSPAKPPAMPERIEAVLQLRE